MTGGREAAPRPGRAPLRQRSRRRWAIAAGVAAGWVVLEVVTGSMVSATVVLVIIAVLGTASVAGLRALGVTRDHPWIRQMASRPWRDGQDVLRVAMRHLCDVFVVTPSGSLLAPSAVEVHLNPGDLRSLCERMELGVISASLTEVYEDQVAEYGARMAGTGRADVYVVADDSVPPGRYRLRQGDPVGAGGPPAPPARPEVRYAGAAPEFAYAAPRQVYAEPDAFEPDGFDSDGFAWQMPDQQMPGQKVPDPRLTAVGGMTTIMEQAVAPVPVLRLVTGRSVAETQLSGARAGRGSVELVLPDEPTVSREHARFTFSDRRWWIANQGRNGLCLNGAPVVGEQPLSDGDEIRWGARPDALMSRVEIR